jgi:phosphocarrier protein HPr
MTTPSSRIVTIVNRRGLHARASARFVKCAEAFECEVTVIKDGQSVGGTSIMGLMTLAAAPGSTVELTAQGPQAEAALDALSSLIADGFGETD